MGPPKRKGTTRRQVLDLNTGEDSPSRPTWQTKYQNALPEEEIHQNGDSQSSLPAQNPLSDLLGSYNSDSENEEGTAKPKKSSLDEKVEDFLKEIQSISVEESEKTQKGEKVAQNSEEEMPYPPSVIAWQQCFDHNSGYPYYWNTETNEVTWEIPPDLKSAIASVAAKQKSQEEAKTTVAKFSWQTGSEEEKVKKIVEPLEKKKVSDSLTPAPEDTEGLIESTYETSSLLTHGVQDTGPPGDDCFHLASKVPPTSAKDESKPQVSLPKCESTLSDQLETHENKLPDKKIVDNVIAQIEKETPPDYKEKSEKSPPNQTSGIALIANYGDDSESEDNTVSEKRKSINKSPTKPLFPIEIPKETPKPLFPCMTSDTPKPSIETRPKDPPQDEPEPFSNKYNVESEDPAAQKAFKRKKRFEFATTVLGPSTSKAIETKTEILDERPVTVPTTQYNLDPNSNDHHGFGFNSLKPQTDSEKKTYRGYGGIQFVKAETLNLSEVKPEPELESKNSPKPSPKDPIKDDEIEESASLLREKVTFLTGGTECISPIQQMAIQLETLVLAWQEGALTPSYLLRWLKEKCSELMRYEKTAAPSGWTCLWDRKSKRYYYRNTTTRAIQWEYPNVEEKNKGKDGESEGAGDEMDICDTPPHSSPSGHEKVTDEMLPTPSSPVIPDTSARVSPTDLTSQPSAPPQREALSVESDSPGSKVVRKKKRKAEEAIEDEGASHTPPPVTETPETPPLPPMPPPPPPPPDETPPPLPDSPPPIPLDQPLPPGVDEPEYSLFRTSKHSYKKAQPESTAYSAELMMTYSYGLPVQQVVSTNGQPVAMPMQPLDYHTYLHESVTSPYIVQSAATTHVIHCPAKKPKPSLTSELVNFYSDLAMLDNVKETKNAQTVPATTPSSAPPTPVEPKSAPPPKQSPPPAPASIPTPPMESKPTETVTSNGVTTKKKKKTKTTTAGLSLKKKGVSSLVAKWQQVQQEVRRDFSDDDSDLSSAK